MAIGEEVQCVKQENSRASNSGQMPKDAKSMMQPYCRKAWIDISGQPPDASAVGLSPPSADAPARSYGNIDCTYVSKGSWSCNIVHPCGYLYKATSIEFILWSTTVEVQKHLSFCSKVWANLTCLGHLLLQRLHVFHHHLLLLKTRCHMSLCQQII